MLRSLKIQNLVLVEKAEIDFGEGLNILTGETGAGKSAVLAAIRLIAGMRADTGLVGTRGEIAIVEAEVEGKIFRREIHRSGKSRCFVEEEQVSLAELKEKLGKSIDFVDAEHSFALCALENQRAMFDAALGLTDEVEQLRASFAEEAALQAQLDELTASQETRTRDLAWTEEDLAHIDTVRWKAGEEEALAAEHKILVHAQELTEKLGIASEGLAATSLKQIAASLERTATLDPKLSPLSLQCKAAALEIDEVQSQLHTYLSKLDADPKRLEVVEERIGMIERLKRKYGKTIEEVEEKKKRLQERVSQLTHLEEEIEKWREKWKKKKEENLRLAAQLLEKRRAGEPLFTDQVLQQLYDLNLPHAQFLVSLKDEIRFLFSANPGHAPIPLEECASGGERARLLLAMKTVLAKREKKGCLIFDEIDSNVGGHTATALGEKLKQIAEHAQVICVTHFVQVAKCAQHHFAVSKNGSAITTITHLQAHSKAQEYRRMLGSLDNSEP